ncbi:nuclear localization sequence binding protein [Coemansia sp. RSA 1933]|nr:nuclear localization sequence binding protein [Coemansia sp. RSA 1933]
MTKATSAKGKSTTSKKVSKKEQVKQKEEESSDSEASSDAGSDSSDNESSDSSASENEEEEKEAASSESEKDGESSSDEEESSDGSDSDNDSSSSSEEEESSDAGKRKAASDVEMEDSEGDSEEKSAKKQKTDGDNKTYTVFVGNLSFSVTDESLATAFGEFGEVVAARVAMQPNSGRSRGFGYVDFASEDAQEKATAATDFEVEGRTVRMEKTEGQARDGKQPRAQGPSTSEPSKVLFIGNMSFRSTEDSVRSAFEECGTVVSVRIITDRETGRPKGYGYIEFDSVEAAANAMQWNNTDLDGRNIRLDYSAPRQNAGGSGGRGGGRGGFRGGRGGFRGGRGRF